MSFLTLVVQTDPNTMLGYLAGANIQSNPSTGDGTGNAVFGYNAALALTTGARNTIVGNGAGISLTTGVDNVLLGNGAGALLSGGAQANVAIGNVGTGGRNAVLQSVAVGAQALAAQNGTLGAQRNTALGASAGASIIQGEYNTVLGYGAGALITSGSKNSILGSYSGNQGGLDIRTLSNYIVLSDGDGNPRLWIDNTGAASIPGGILSPTISGSLTITGGTVTASNPVLQATQTWDNAAVTFTGWRLNITDTFSAAGSLLMDLQTGGTSLFRVTKDGLLRLPFGTGTPNTGGSPGIQLLSGANVWGAIFAHNGGSSGGGICLSPYGSLSTFLNVGANQVSIGASMPFGWASSAGNVQVGLALALFNESGVLAQRNGVNAQTFRLYNTFTDASNYERLAVMWSSNIAFIALENAGTGSTRTIFIGGGGKGIEFNPGGNSITLKPSGGPGPIFGNTGINFNGWTSGVEYSVLGPSTQSGNTNRAGADVGIYPLGGSGNGAAGQVLLYASLAAASGTAGHTFEFGVRTFLPATGTPGLQFGGTTASFPALKRRSANLQTVGADDAGTAGFIVGNQALATTATDGFIYVPSCAGVPTGVPTAYTGTIPHVVDTTNKHAYWYIAGAWWRANLV